MSQRLNRMLSYALPGFFGSLVFFCLPHAAGGYRTVKWACAGFLLFCLTALLFRSIECLRLPSSNLFLLAAAFFPLSLAFSLFADGTDVVISLIGISRYFIGIAFLILTGFIWSSLEQQQKEARLFYLLVIAALSTIPLIFSFYGMYHEGHIFEPDITGTFGNPNWAAGYFVAVIPVALCFLFTASDNLKRWLVSLSLVMVAAGIAVSFSKTAAGTGTVMLGVSLFVFYKNRVFRKILLLCVALLCLFFVYHFHQIILIWLEPRLFIWKALIIAMRDTWLIGNGALQALRNIEGGASQVIAGSINSYMPSSQVDFVHNDFLQALAEGGITGLVSFLVIVFTTLAKAFRAGSRLAQTAGLSFLALSINSLGESPRQVPVTFYAWWFFMAIIWFDHIAEKGLTVKKTGAVKALLLVAMVLFVTEGARQSIGVYYWTKSGGTTTLVEQNKCLKTASLLLPEVGNVQTEYAQALTRSRQHMQARKYAVRAKAVKFDYDDLYVITEADIALKVIDPVPAWKDIADKFPCLNYPRFKLAETYLKNKSYQQARDECNVIMRNNCNAVNPGQPYYNQAVKIIELLDKLEQEGTE